MQNTFFDDSLNPVIDPGSTNWAQDGYGSGADGGQAEMDTGRDSIINQLDSVAINQAKILYQDKNPLFLLNRNDEKDFFTMDDVFSW